MSRTDIEQKSGSAGHKRRRLLAAAVAAVRFGMTASVAAQSADPAASGFPIEGAMPPLDGATAWINTAPLASADLRGKIVLVEFWTYTCINWLRSHPYVRAWEQKYRENGLVVLGVHTPEFSFERDPANVRRAVQDMKIGYPVAIDSAQAIWRAFDNSYWPAFYIVDAQGRIRHHQFGEGGYDQTERAIQRLLIEAGASSVRQDLVSAEGQGLEATADWTDLGSPETYVGYDQARGFASPHGAALNHPRSYAYPTRLRLNAWALAGNWTIRNEPAVLNTPDGRIAYRFNARDLHLVMGPSTVGNPVRFRVLIDGQPPGPAHGLDVDGQGFGTTAWPRLHQLIRQPKPIAERQFEIVFLDAGAQAFSFTFG
jgi:thiol-disulfide isomerase/thioredoxin